MADEQTERAGAPRSETPRLAKANWILLFALFVFCTLYVPIYQGRFKIKVGVLELTPQRAADELDDKIWRLERRMLDADRQAAGDSKGLAKTIANVSTLRKAVEGLGEETVPLKTFNKRMTDLTTRLASIESKSDPSAKTVSWSAVKATSKSVDLAEATSVARADPVLPRRILWVDDDQRAIRGQVELLRDVYGVQVVTLTTAREALDALRDDKDRPFGALITDTARKDGRKIFRSQSAGIDLIREVQKLRPRIICIVWGKSVPDADDLAQLNVRYVQKGDTARLIAELGRSSEAPAALGFGP